MYDIILGRSSSDAEKLGKRGTVLIGKQYVQMGQTSSLSNPIYLDVARAHAMLIVGKRGGGKCLHEDSDVILEDGRIEKIKNLEKDQSKILTLNTDYKLQKGEKTEFYKREVEELLEITLRSGKKIKLTPEHPLLSINEWKEAKSFSCGDRIATPRNYSIEGSCSIGVHKAKLLGYLLAEEHLENNFVLFSNKDLKIYEDFHESVIKFDSSLKIKRHGEHCYRIVQNKKRVVTIDKRNNKGQILTSVYGNSKSSLRDWLDEIKIYRTKSGTKFVPEIIFTAPNSEIKYFLNALFSSDGSIYKKGTNWQISYCSISENMIQQISHLLLRFEIINKIRKRNIKYKDGKKEINEIYIDGINVIKFISKIGFVGKKELRAKRALKNLNKNRNPNLDTIPKEIWERYRPKCSWVDIGRKLDYKHPKAARESIRYSPSRNKMLQIALTDNCIETKNLAQSDIFWDEIVEIKKLKGKFKVYDISCPEYNNFVANDIIVHNSYTMGSIAEGLADMDPEVSKNLAFVMLDTMGVYWSMKYPNKKDSSLLKKWNLEEKGLAVQIYVPGGFYESYKEDGVPVDFPFYIQPRELTVEDWMNAFKLGTDDSVGVAIQRVVTKEIDKKNNFDIDDLIKNIEEDKRLDEKTKLAVINRFESAKSWGIFSKNGTPMKELLKGGKVTVMDLSPYVAMPGGWEIKALVLGIIAKKIFVERMLVRKREELFDIVKKTQVVRQEEVKDDLPMPWLIVDEAHEFLPAEGYAPSSQALITILREGRQPGVSLILATQQPAKIHTDAITQSDVVVAHRLTASFDLEALDKIFLSYNSKGSKALFNAMPRTKGCAIIMDDKNERLHTMQIKPRISWHGGEDPNAIRDIKDEFDFD